MEKPLPTDLQSPARDVSPSSSQPPLSPPTPPTQTLILSNPSARLSSSPASSPRVVEPPPERTRSIRPEMSHHTGPDSFKDRAEDESDMWRRRSNVAETHMGESGQEEANRGRQGEEHASPSNQTGPETARPVSLRRLGKGYVVHHRASESKESDVGSLSAQQQQQQQKQQHRHRRNTSESIADSIVNVHYNTMIALESLALDIPNTPDRPRPLLQNAVTSPIKAKNISFSESRNMQLSPIQTHYHGDEHAAHLPTHYVRTPYPFTMTKEFPQPRREKYDTKKGKQVLGIARVDGEAFDLRSRLERNQDAQGVVRTQTTYSRARKEFPTTADEQSGPGPRSRLYVTLQKRRWNFFFGSSSRPQQGVESFAIPNNLTTTRAEQKSKSRKGARKKDIKKLMTEQAGSSAQGNASSPLVAFDDMIFAQRLRSAYNDLAGPWPLRIFSARKLTGIRLVRIDKWSGGIHDGGSDLAGTGWNPFGASSPVGKHFLAARNGSGLNDDGHGDAGGEEEGGGENDGFDYGIFNEENLMRLFLKPKTGEARYTWVHWAQRLSASCSSTPPRDIASSSSASSSPSSSSQLEPGSGSEAETEEEGEFESDIDNDNVGHDAEEVENHKDSSRDDNGTSSGNHNTHKPDQLQHQQQHQADVKTTEPKPNPEEKEEEETTTKSPNTEPPTKTTQEHHPPPTPTPHPNAAPQHKLQKPRTRTPKSKTPRPKNIPPSILYLHPPSPPPPPTAGHDTLPALQFTRALSLRRVFAAATLILCLSAVSGLLWIFLGGGAASTSTSPSTSTSSAASGNTPSVATLPSRLPVPIPVPGPGAGMGMRASTTAVLPAPPPRVTGALNRVAASSLQVLDDDTAVGKKDALSRLPLPLPPSSEDRKQGSTKDAQNIGLNDNNNDNDGHEDGKRNDRGPRSRVVGGILIAGVAFGVLGAGGVGWAVFS